MASNFDDDEERKELKTPDIFASDDDSGTEFIFNENLISDSSSIPTVHQPAVTSASNENEEIPFESNEWLIIDLSTGTSRPPRQIEFLEAMLQNPRYRSYISWIDEEQGLFEIHQPEKVAQLWDRVKTRNTKGQMNYKKFSRALRHNYSTGVMKKTYRRHIYCFNRSKEN